MQEKAHKREKESKKRIKSPFQEFTKEDEEV